MLRSMTGFGRCLVENANLTQQWEVKSVNGRHLDLKWRLPWPCAAWSHAWKKWSGASPRAAGWTSA